MVLLGVLGTMAALGIWLQVSLLEPPAVKPALSYLQGVVQAGDQVLFKASRAVGLERIVAELCNSLAERGAQEPFERRAKPCSLS